MAEVPAQKETSARGWFKIIVTFLLVCIVLTATVHIWGMPLVQAAIDAGNEQAEFVMTEGNGNPLRANGEAQLAELFTLLSGFGLIMAVVGLPIAGVVQVTTNLFWRKAKPPPLNTQFTGI